MIKVAFYIDNASIANVDCSRLHMGNPGIGGTEFLFYSTVYALQLTKSQINVMLLVSTECRLPVDFAYEIVNGENEINEYCEKENIEILVIRGGQFDVRREVRFKIVIWAHNIMNRATLNELAKNKNIARIVTVGREQADLYRDNKAFLKTVAISNWVYMEDKSYYNKINVPFRIRANEVTYLGSLVSGKGFHILAKAWKKVLEKVPDAHLNVIGSASVYGITNLGKFGVAEQEYENRFMSYLIDSNGKILPSVTFYGKMGVEKENILCKTKVGVPNPSGVSESFCISAIEMGLYGAKIVTKRYCGYLETVPLCVGHLYNHEKDLADYIISALKQKDYNFDSFYKYVKKNFSWEAIFPQWVDLFEEIHKKNVVAILPIQSNLKYNYKYIREINRKVKSVIPFGYMLPTLDWYIEAWNRLSPFKINIVY